MSTPRECLFVEVKGKWYLLLEDTNAPLNAFDWTDYAHGYGPFNNFNAAEQYLDNFSNPGGYDTQEGVELDKLPEDSGIRQLIEKAQRPVRNRRW